MGRSSKRAAPTAASQRPAKKRKSAESSLAKVKEIADAEDAFPDDEKQEVRPLLWKHNAADSDGESEGEAEEGFVGHDIVTKDATPVVAPGFRLWKTDSRLASKGELSQAAQVSILALIPPTRSFAHLSSTTRRRISTRIF